MIKYNNRNKVGNSINSKKKQLQSFIKMHSSRINIAKCEKQNITLRVTNLEQILKSNQTQNLQKKSICKSPFDLQGNPNHFKQFQQQIYQCEERQMKKYNKMYEGLQMYDERIQEKLKQENNKMNQNNRSKKNMQIQKVSYLHHSQRSNIAQIPFYKRINKTVKGWRNLKKIQQKIFNLEKNKNLILPIQQYYSNQRFDKLRKKITYLENQACTYGIKIDFEQSIVRQFDQQIKQLKRKQQQLCRRLKPKQTSCIFQQLKKKCGRVFKEDFVPNYLMESSSKNVSQFNILKRAFTKNLQKNYLKILC